MQKEGEGDFYPSTEGGVDGNTVFSSILMSKKKTKIIPSSIFIEENIQCVHLLWV